MFSLLPAERLCAFARRRGYATSRYAELSPLCRRDPREMRRSGVLRHGLRDVDRVPVRVLNRELPVAPGLCRDRMDELGPPLKISEGGIQVIHPEVEVQMVPLAHERNGGIGVVDQFQVE